LLAQSLLLAFTGFTSFVWSIMDEFWVRSKVGCHRAVDIFGLRQESSPSYFRFMPENSPATSGKVIISIIGSIGDRTKPCLS
jgi:hypothetical protein